MRNNPKGFAVFCAVVLAVACSGCDARHDANARRLIEPASMPGKVMLAFTGTGEQLVKQGRISLHRRIKGLDDCEIDVWVINSRLADAARPDREITRGTVVLLHPLLTGKSWFLPLGETLARRGWDVVLPDLRAHGRSGGKYITWGAKEKYDVKCVIDQLVRDKLISDRIYVLGSSMGGLVAVQYAAIERRCKGVMAVAPPASARQIARRMLLMESPADFEEALRRAGKLAGFDPAETSAVKAAEKLSCPLVIVHGIWDFIVPFQHSEEIYRAAPDPKRFVTLFIDGHTPEIARSEWFATQIDSLAGMGKSGTTMPTPSGTGASPVSKEIMTGTLPAGRQAAMPRGTVVPPGRSSDANSRDSKAPLNAARLKAAIDLSAGYLIRACGRDGKFVYRINTNPDITPKPAYNILRHAGTVYALATYEQTRPSKDTRDAIARAVRFLKKEAVSPIPGRKDLLGVWSCERISRKRIPDQVKLGGVGLGLVALLSAEKAGAVKTPIEDLRKMGRCILFMQKTDGSFNSKFIPALGGLTGEWISLYYPGEAALGLLMLYEKDPSPKWLQGAANAIAYLARIRTKQSDIKPDQWTLLAMSKLLPLYGRCKQPVPREVLLRHARQICNRMLSAQAKCPVGSPAHGSFGKDGRTCPTATDLEGMLAAMTYLPAEDKALRGRIDAAVKPAMSFLLRAQIRSGRNAGGIPRAIRPLPAGHPGLEKSFNRRVTEVRIDYVQHAMCAMIQFVQHRGWRGR